MMAARNVHSRTERLEHVSVKFIFIRLQNAAINESVEGKDGVEGAILTVERSRSDCVPSLCGAG